MYFLYDNKYNGKCRYTQHYKDNINTFDRYLLEHDVDMMIRDNISAGIVSRLHNKEFYKLVSNTVPFGFPTTEKGYIVKSKETDTEIFVTGRGAFAQSLNFMPIDMIEKNTHWINTHKVFIVTGGDAMASRPHYVYGKPFYGKPNTICNGSYLLVGPFKTIDICNNIIKYLSTRWVRFLVSLVKPDQRVYASTFKCVPIENFTTSSDIDWSKSIAEIDQQLYKKYNLTDEEIAYIEKTIKPME